MPYDYLSWKKIPQSNEVVVMEAVKPEKVEICMIVCYFI